MNDSGTDLATNSAELGLAMVERALAGRDRLPPGDARAEALLESAVRQLRRTVPLLGDDRRHRGLRASVYEELALAVNARPWRHDVDDSEAARAYLEAALTEVDPADEPRVWGRLQHNVGVNYQNRVVGDVADNRERAVGHLESALSVMPEDDADSRAITLSQLGNAYNLRLKGDRADNVDRAVAYYGQALQIRRPDRDPVRWGITQHNLGMLFGVRGRGNRRDNLRAAIDCFTRALTVRTREDYPEYWAMTMRELGNVYLQLGDRESLLAGERCLRDTLTVYSREAVPGEWAPVQLGLANAAEQRGAPGDAQALLRPLLDLPLERDRPQLWARVVASFGRATFDLALAQHDVRQLELAVGMMRRGVDRLIGDGELTMARIAATQLADRLLMVEQWGPAADAYAVALDADARQYAASLSLASREIEISESRGTAARAAFALASGGHVSRAVDVLERGRGRMLGEALARDRADLHALLEGDQRGRAAAERYLAAAAKVRALEGQERQRTGW